MNDLVKVESLDESTRLLAGVVRCGLMGFETLADAVRKSPQALLAALAGTLDESGAAG